MQANRNIIIILGMLAFLGYLYLSQKPSGAAGGIGLSYTVISQGPKYIIVP
jgi:hypothetical protein